jgi:hypothetical protein
MTRSPLERESARCSAWPRHTFTLKNEVSPSRHSPSCWTPWVTATRRLVTGVPVLVNRSSGSSTRFPAMVVWLSAASRRAVQEQQAWRARRRSTRVMPSRMVQSPPSTIGTVSESRAAPRASASATAWSRSPCGLSRPVAGSTSGRRAGRPAAARAGRPAARPGRRRAGPRGAARPPGRAGRGGRAPGRWCRWARYPGSSRLVWWPIVPQTPDAPGRGRPRDRRRPAVWWSRIRRRTWPS